jgi:hypothetical protein
MIANTSWHHYGDFEPSRHEEKSAPQGGAFSNLSNGVD